MSKEMTVQEAIEFCKSAKRSASGYGNTYMALEKLPQIIALLKRGEAYEKIWEELEMIIAPSVEQNKIYPAKEYIKEMKWIKQKYLKEAKIPEQDMKDVVNGLFDINWKECFKKDKKEAKQTETNYKRNTIIKK